MPEALVSGDHGRVRLWRRREALRATLMRRPDLLRRARLGAEDAALLRGIQDEIDQGAGAAGEKPFIRSERQEVEP